MLCIRFTMRKQNPSETVSEIIDKGSFQSAAEKPHRRL
jgi:hypothetical protein